MRNPVIRKLLLTLILASSPALAAFTLIASGGYSGTPLVINTTGATMTIVGLSGFGTDTSSVPHDFVGINFNDSCYTKVASQTNPGHNGSIALWVCYNPVYTGVANGYSASGGIGMYVSVFGGSGTSLALDQVSAGANTTAATIQPGTITPSCTNEVVVVGWGSDSGTAGTVSGATLIAAFPTATVNGGGTAYAIQTTAAAFNPTVTINSGSHNAAVSSSFKSSDSSCGGARRRVITVTGGGIMNRNRVYPVIVCAAALIWK